jgi:hypothetical protein
VEYLAIVGIALLVLVTGAMIFMDYSRSSSNEVLSNQLFMIGTSIMSNAEAMYVLGNESWVTVEFNFPNTVSEAAIVGNRDLFFSYAGYGGESQVVFFSQRFDISTDNALCPDTCSLGLTPGMNKLKIKSQGNFVVIQKVN